MRYDYLIHEQYETLTRSEKKVADYVLKVGSQLMYATMSDIKMATKVGDATIIRFCQKLGFSGFSDFKIEIAKEDFTQKEQTRPADYYDDINRHLQDALTATAQLIDPNRLNQAIDLLSQAKSIYIFGVGGSAQVSESFASILLRVGVQATPVSDPHIQAQVASLFKSTDLVIGLSLTGRTKDTYDALKIAKNNQAKVIAITNNLNSPVAQLGDVVLQTAIEEFLNGGSVAGRISQLYICDVLTQGYENRNQVDAVALREKVLRSILDKSLD
ncbi:MurR/RpiR family transcriptional regulator [Lactobacillus sp. CBA3606]|uniref:MurR/RpiR family transcriptional regulator n=1 Tax=Lactobacillus sp. CBA3606 TaxID=2099789 RepID=UPI000CFDF93A|nr:MurR/RpiR family transcriptional regulator [Lactobacillus sp. CBA3606]AVK64172.1 MurR/RpiR family transcriptional regulator [Lactobacillus sp. CBA3606]